MIRTLCFPAPKFFATIVTAFTLLVATTTAHAFKIDTHVWVAQEVLNDVVPDGRVTIEGREYPVAQHIWRALADYPSQYRMGNIGPDFLPDILVGQMAVHPGIVKDKPTAWKTDEWLSWVLSGSSSPENLAFNYGYLGHAASDIFAHSYVNTYTGGIFLLTKDAPGQAAEQEVELRHFALESYMARHNPPLRDHNGNYLGKPSAVIVTPASYLRDRLVFNDEVQSQHSKQILTKHLEGMYALHKAIGRVRDKVNDIDGVVIPAQLTRLLGQTAEIEARIAEHAAEIERLTNEILAKTSLFNINLQLIPVKERLILAKVQEIEAIGNAINSLQSLIAQRNAQVADLQNQLANTVREACNSCPPWPRTPPGCGGGLRPRCLPDPCRIICSITQAWIDINNRLSQAILDRDAAVADLNARLFDKTVAERVKAEAEIALAALRVESAALQATIDIANTLLQQRQMARQEALATLLAVKEEIAQTNTIRLAHVYVIRAMLDRWQRDVGLGVEAYVTAGGETAKVVMDGSANPLQPYIDWRTCWAPVFSGIPSDIPNTVCKIEGSINSLKQAIADFQAALGPLNWLVDPVGQVSTLVLQELEPVMIDAAIQISNNVGAPAVADLIRLIRGAGTTAEDLNAIFAGDSSTKNLLLISDVATRINADMHLTPQGHFDPTRYRVIRNAVVLAKMTLLDPATLNRIAADIVPNLALTAYGPTLYPEYSTGMEAFNILIGAVKSIDGNQQWQQLGLPYLRRGTTLDPVWPYTGALDLDHLESYGYGYRNAAKGFRFWEDGSVREYTFRNQATALFKGPLAPGIEYPEEFGLPRIIRLDYPFRACPQNPFPRTTNNDGTFVVDAAGMRRDNGCDGDLVVNIVPTLINGTLRVQYTVTNIGSNRTNSSTVALYLSADPVRDGADALLAQRAVRALRAGESVSWTIRAALPAGTLPGNYYLIAAVDPTGVVAEAIESNNSSVVPIVVP